MRVVGCDPGLTGALAVVETDGPRLVEVLDMPVVRYGATALVDGAVLLDWLEEQRPEVAVVERAGARPGEGRSSGFAFGVAAGGLLTALSAAGLQLELVAPQTWKRRAGLLGRDKRASRELATLRLGASAQWQRAKDHGRAEAALIALYGRAG